MKKEKFIYINYLKLIGLFLIILAHVCKNSYILQLRNFDVPLMVIISGFLAYGSYNRSIEKDKSLLKYYWKRISRLLIPTWIFLTIYFLLIKIAFINKEYPYDFNKILRSFLLIDGIGYVWVIRVYLMCSFITPLIFYLNDKIKSNKIKFLILVAIYVLYELFVYFEINELNFIFNYIIAYIIPYGCIYILGMISKNTSPKTDGKISSIFIILFMISFIIINFKNGLFQSTQTMKYPPTMYYISYALFVSFLLLCIAKSVKLKDFKIIDFCSKSSLWIYLWHIMFLSITSAFIGDLHWIIKYILVLIGSIVVTYIQNEIIDIIEEKTKINKNILKVFRG